MTSPIRQALGAHLGQVLTPELAVLIEQAAFFAPGNSEETKAALNQWRHLIEPTINASSRPVPWDAVLSTRVNIASAANSVLVSLPASVQSGVFTVTIWIAAGDMGEVLALISDLQDQSKASGVKAINYAGRRGWVRAAGFTEKAVFGHKEIP